MKRCPRQKLASPRQTKIRPAFVEHCHACRLVRVADDGKLRRGLDLDTREASLIWCGEFGRLPIAHKSAKPGRDHNPHCFTAWLTWPEM